MQRATQKKRMQCAPTPKENARSVTGRAVQYFFFDQAG